MRRAIVPAQITTVEDRIAGNLSVHQALLLGIPILFGFCIALLLPPFEQLSGYKVIVCICVVILCGGLAIRIKDQIVGQWAILLIRYIARPRYYVYDKNTSYLRSRPVLESISEEVTVDEREESVSFSPVEVHDKVRLGLLANGKTMSVKFTVGKKGKLNVHVSEAK